MPETKALYPVNIIQSPGSKTTKMFCCFSLTKHKHAPHHHHHHHHTHFCTTCTTQAKLDASSVMLRMRGNDPLCLWVGGAVKADNHEVVCNCTQCDCMLRFLLFLMCKLYILLGTLESREVIAWFRQSLPFYRRSLDLSPQEQNA